MNLNGFKRMLNIGSTNAIAYFTNVNSDRRLGFRVYDDMLEVKYDYRRPEFLQLDEESEQAASDHDSRPIIIPHRELPFNAGYAEYVLHLNMIPRSFFCFLVDERSMSLTLFLAHYEVFVYPIAQKRIFQLKFQRKIGKELILFSPECNNSILCLF